MKKPLDDTIKVFHLERGLGNKNREFRIVMLSKAPYPFFNQFVLALKNHELQLSLEVAEKKEQQIDHNQAFLSQRGRSRRGGRNFSPRGRGNYLGKGPNTTQQKYCCSIPSKKLQLNRKQVWLQR